MPETPVPPQQAPENAPADPPPPEPVPPPPLVRPAATRVGRAAVPNPWRDVDDDLFVDEGWTVETAPPGHEMKGAPGDLLPMMQKLRNAPPRNSKDPPIQATLVAPDGTKVERMHEGFVASRTAQWRSWRVELHVGAVKTVLFKGPKPEAIDRFDKETKRQGDEGTVVLLAGNGNLLDQFARLTRRRPVVQFSEKGPEVFFPDPPPPAAPARPNVFSRAVDVVKGGASILRRAAKLLRGRR